MMKPLVSLSLLLLLPIAARANDSAFEGVGGSLRPTLGENKAIRMVRESVVLTARINDYSTRADFVFSNETARPQTVSMGFPEGNFGDVSADGPMKTTGFRGFATSVDGKGVAAKRTILKEADASGFDTYWVKTVPFAPHQTRRVRVQFSSPYGGSVDWGFSRAMSYAFTGKNWRDKVGESVLEVHIGTPGLWRVVASGEGTSILPLQTQLSPNSATFRHVWKNWEAQENVIIGMERSTPFWRVDATYADNGSITMKTVAATQTIRIGAKPKTMEDSQGRNADAFSQNGTLYVALSHLEDRLNSWGEAQTPKIATNLGYAATQGFDLRAGKTRIQGRAGESVLRVNGKTVAAGGPILSVPNSGTRYLYVPLAPLARELGWTFALRGERLFTFERGNWHG